MGADNKIAGAPRSLIDVKQRASDSVYQFASSSKGCGIIEVADTGDKGSDRPVRKRTGLEALSAVKMSEDLTAAVDAWAEAHQMARSDAIRRLVEFGLKAAPVAASAAPHHTIADDTGSIEDVAVRQIDQLLDPSLPADERDRRIRRLTEGPPEFSTDRVDLPKHRT